MKKIIFRISAIIVSVLAVFAITTTPAHAVSVNVSHKSESVLATVHCQDAYSDVWIARGTLKTGVLKNPPRRCWVPKGYDFVWNPIGPGIYGCAEKDYSRWCNNLPWSATAIQVWFKY